ncbi:MAG: DUF1517 domain-containing protein [Microcystaceae cyanobacterium]
MGLRDRFNKMTGKTRYGVTRLFVHLSGDNVAPLLGILNQQGRAAVDSEGDFDVLGEGLVDICQKLIEMRYNWRSAANEGDIVWNEGEAGDYVTELFTDSAQRYLSEPDFDDTSEENTPLSLPVTANVIVMITVAYTGESPDLETNLADFEALEYGLKALINLQYNGKLKAIQVHFSPAQLGDILTDEQLLVNFPELVPL